MVSITEVDEYHSGLRGGLYYYVVDGNKLIHISKYAFSKRKIREVVTYYIDFEKIRDKTIIEVVSTNEGPLDFIWEFKAEDLLLKRDERRAMLQPFTILNNYELTYLGPKERRFIIYEWDRYYRPMLRYIKKEIFEKKGYLYTSSLLHIHLKNDLSYPISFLIPYSERARLMSLNSLTKMIHQIWIIIKILREFPSEPLSLTFRQSSDSPLIILGDYAVWYEFDLNPHTMFRGYLWRNDISSELAEIYKRAKTIINESKLDPVPLRPDIVFTYAKSVEEFMIRPLIKLIIECKNLDYITWAEEVEKQIKPYAKIFRPEHMLVASLKPVPQYLKKELLKENIEIIDNVYPGGSGDEELVQYVSQLLK